MNLISSLPHLGDLLSDGFRFLPFGDSSPPRELWGKTVVIADGAGDLGFALAQAFVAEGCNVAVCDERESDLALVGQKLEAQDASVFTERCDVTQSGEVERFVAHVQERFETIDVVLLHDAAVGFSPRLQADLARAGAEVTTVLHGLRPPSVVLRQTDRDPPLHDFGVFFASLFAGVSRFTLQQTARSVVDAAARGESLRPSLLSTRLTQLFRAGFSQRSLPAFPNHFSPLVE